VVYEGGGGGREGGREEEEEEAEEVSELRGSATVDAVHQSAV
jgi:hypothetical protein